MNPTQYKYNSKPSKKPSLDNIPEEIDNVTTHTIASPRDIPAAPTPPPSPSLHAANGPVPSPIDLMEVNLRFQQPKKLKTQARLTSS
jgi:hypothetical protein